MFDSAVSERLSYISPDKGGVVVGGTRIFWILKRVFDLLGSVLLLPLLGLAVVSLFIVNRFWNKGSLFYVQKRMGKGCASFNAIKFRSMREANQIHRGPDDPIEIERITPLGRFLRCSRIDELPQILNVLKGDMSLIGPRPDYAVHAEWFLNNVPGYRERHSVRPGISGLAQVDLGYAVGSDATQNKVNVDLSYIQNACFALEAKLVLKTVYTVATRAGA